jgi:kynureninase
MLAMEGMLDLIEEAQIAAIRAKSVSLTEFVVRAYDDLLAPADVQLLSPRDPARRGGHVSIGHPRFREVTERLWRGGVIPDFRHPDGIRLGLSPLSTTHVEAAIGVLAVWETLSGTR